MFFFPLKILRCLKFLLEMSMFFKFLKVVFLRFFYDLLKMNSRVFSLGSFFTVFLVFLLDFTMIVFVFFLFVLRLFYDFSNSFLWMVFLCFCSGVL